MCSGSRDWTGRWIRWSVLELGHSGMVGHAPVFLISNWISNWKGTEGKELREGEDAQLGDSGIRGKGKIWHARRPDSHRQKGKQNRPII